MDYPVTAAATIAEALLGEWETVDIRVSRRMDPEAAGVSDRRHRTGSYRRCR
jgi:hypothetical protein